LSYAVNAGISDYVRSAPPMPTDPPMDYEENGIFFDEYAPVLNPTRPKAPRIDMSYLSKHDGAQHTILCSENLDALDWIHLQAPPPAVLPKYIADEREPSYFQAIIWVMFEPPAPPSWGMAGSPPTGTVLNKYQTTFPSMPNWEEMDYGYGRPSSNHGGGFVVTFCDGHSQFMSEDIAYRVYCLLMSPNSQKARDPRYISYPSGSVYPANWYQTSTATAYGDPIVPLTDADLNN
jgi:prepilin-type processing-associated H-X9-DG protein